MIELRLDVRPAWPFRLPPAGADGLLRRRGATLRRLLHSDGAPVLVAVAQLGPDRVRFAARAADEPAAGWGIERVRFALGVDDDLAPFHRRFRDDPLLGAALRAEPTLRVGRRPDPWEALAWSVCEQLIDSDRALAIQRALTRRLGRAAHDQRDAPTADAVAGAAPAELEGCGLTAARARALRRAAREVATGRAELHAAGHEAGWARLRTIPGIGRWTVDMLAVHGQGRLDQVAAGDLHYLKAVGRLREGRPGARASEEQVRELLAPYGEWRAQAGAYLLWLSFTGRLDSARPATGRLASARSAPGGLSSARPAPGPAPRPAGTRSSAPAPRSAAA